MITRKQAIMELTAFHENYKRNYSCSSEGLDLVHDYLRSLHSDPELIDRIRNEIQPIKNDINLIYGVFSSIRDRLDLLEKK